MTYTTKHRVNDIVQFRTARSTGTMVMIIRTGPGSWVEQEPGWMTICDDHGGCVMHDTLSDARAWAPHPEGWCPDCQAGHGPGEVTELVS